MKNDILRAFFSTIHHPSENTMEGCTVLRKYCATCKRYRATIGSKTLDNGTKRRSFVCADCASDTKP